MRTFKTRYYGRLTQSQIKLAEDLELKAYDRVAPLICKRFPELIWSGHDSAGRPFPYLLRYGRHATTPWMRFNRKRFEAGGSSHDVVMSLGFNAYKHPQGPPYVRPISSIPRLIFLDSLEYHEDQGYPFQPTFVEIRVYDKSYLAPARELMPEIDKVLFDGASSVQFYQSESEPE